MGNRKTEEKIKTTCEATKGAQACTVCESLFEQTIDGVIITKNEKIVHLTHSEIAFFIEFYQPPFPPLFGEPLPEF